MDCGGKRSATPLSDGQRIPKIRLSHVRAKAPSPLRSAGAVHDTPMALDAHGHSRSVLECAGPPALSPARSGNESKQALVRTKAAVNAPHSKRFAKFTAAKQSRQRLECGGFSTAFANPQRTFGQKPDPKSFCRF
jgi:hypothetical protein